MADARLVLTYVVLGTLGAAAACGAFGESPSGAPPADTGEDAGGFGTPDGAPGATIDSGACSNTAMSFAGDQYLEIEDAADLEGFAPMTIEAWVRTDEVDAGQMDILWHYDHSAAGWGFLINRDGNGLAVRPQFRFYDAGIYQVGGGTVARDTWSHVAAVVETSGAARIYVNGVLEGERSGFIPAAQDLGNKLRIGSGAGTNFRFRGDIDELRIVRAVVYSGPSFPVPRSRLEVTEETVALWHFDEGTGTVAKDAKGVHHAVMPAAPANHPRWKTVPCVAAMRP